ncbi:MAG: hypothetical protein LR011_03730 [Verrucomicrobia bacterium]|nr:hypothetical protein [Verrucomicrobiota bacterium]
MSDAELQRVEEYLAEKWEVDEKVEDEMDELLRSASLWLDASYVTGSTNDPVDGSSVSNWDDLTIHDNDALQSTSSRRPVYRKSGGERVEFNGSQFLEVADDESLDPTLGITLFYVAKPTLSGTHGIASVGGSSSWSHHLTSNGRLSAQLNDGSGAVTLTSSADMRAVSGERSIFGLRLSGPKMEFMLNGNHESSSTDRGSIRNTTDKLYVGSLGTSSIFAGEFLEYILYNRALTDLEVQRVETYLAEKWDIQESLPEDHPASVLPPIVDSNVGSVWKNDPIDLTEDFYISTELYFGDNDDGQGGITITLQNSVDGPDALGGDADNLGAVTPGFGIYFKTDSDPLDPAYDHVGFYENGVIVPVGPDPVRIDPDNDNVEDGSWHKIEIEWDASEQVLKVYYDGEVIQEIQRDIVETALGGNPEVFIGFTAATNPNQPNSYGAKINEVKSPDPDSGRYTLSTRSIGSEELSALGSLIDPTVKIESTPANAPLDGAIVLFRSAFNAATETLGIRGQSGTSGTVNGLNWKYDSSLGGLVLTGEAPVETYQAALRTAAYFNSQFGTSSGVTHEFSISLGRAYPYTGPNGSFDVPHFYMVYDRPDSLSWIEAKKLAETRYYLGYQGYLGTVTSAEEQSIMHSLLNGNPAWLGASDAERDKEWRWVTGPESFDDSQKGRLFFIQNGLPGQTGLGAIGGFAYQGQFSNWSLLSPDNNVLNAPENYAFMDSNGFWDDRELYGNDNIHHYIVEFGGLKGELKNSVYSELVVNFGRADSDGDGIPDAEDLCPGTASGVEVDLVGCGLPSFMANDVFGIMETAIPLDIRPGQHHSTNSYRIIGLPDGAVLSHGFQTRSGFWIVPASDIGSVAVIPPKGYFGVKNLRVAQPGANQLTLLNGGTFGQGVAGVGGNQLQGYTDYSFNASVILPPGSSQYTVTQTTPWLGKAIINDRTSPGSGYFGVFNLNNEDNILTYTFPKMKSGALYEFTFWMANINNTLTGLLDPLKIGISRVDNATPVQLYNTASIYGLDINSIDPQKRWQQHGFILQNDNRTVATLSIDNLSGGILSNLAALDDLTFSRLIVDDMQLTVLGPEISSQDSLGFNNQLIPIIIEKSDIQSARPFLVKGVPVGAELSHGKQLDETTWIVGASAISQLMILPPAGFEGTIDLEIAQFGSNLSVTGRDLAEVNNIELGGSGDFDESRDLVPRIVEAFDPDQTPIVVDYSAANSPEVNKVIVDAVQAIYKLNQAAHMTSSYKVTHKYVHTGNQWPYSGSVTFNATDKRSILKSKLEAELDNIYVQLDSYMATVNGILPANWPLTVPDLSSSFWAPSNGRLVIETVIAGLIPNSITGIRPAGLPYTRMTGAHSVTNFMETVAVDAGTNYVLSFSTQNTGASENVSVTGSINGVDLIHSASVFNDGDWYTLIVEWYSDVATSAEIQIVSSGAVGFETDFTLGDLELAQQISADVTVEVLSSDLIPPVATSTVIQISSTDPISINTVNLAFDNLNELDPETVNIVSSPSHGIVIVHPSTGELTYYPSGEPVDDQIQYVIADEDGNISNVGTIYIAKIINESAPPDLIGYWNFDESSGLTAQDSSSYKNDGQLRNFSDGSAQWVTGQIGNSLEFGGPATQQYVIVPDYPQVTTQMSVSAWVWAATYENYGTIIKNWGEGTTGQFHFDLGPNGNLATFTLGQPDSTPPLEPVSYRPGEGGSIVKLGGIRTNPGKGGVVVDLINPVPLSAWQHFAMVADGTHVILYHNGSQIEKKPYNGKFNTANVSALGIGAKLDDFASGAAFEVPGFLDGRLDDLALWSRGLAPSEIVQIYNNGLAGIPVLEANSSAQAPTITRHPESIEVSQDGAFSLGVGFDGSSPLLVQWFKDGYPILGATGTTYSVESARASDAGEYSVRVNNAAGNVVSSIAVVDVLKIDQLRNDLVGYWRFDAADGTISVDDSGSDHPARIVAPGGTPQWVPAVWECCRF